MRRVVENGGDFLFQLKANQPNALDRAENIAAAQPPPFCCRSTESGHGRVEEREIKVFAAEPLDLGLPQVRTLVVVEKTSAPKGSQNPPTATRSLYLSSHHPREAEFFARLIRGHWAGCEIRNHWVRDALFEEDATRSKNINLNANLAMLRCALIAVKARLCPDLPWPALHQLCSMRPATAYNLVCLHRFK